MRPPKTEEFPSTQTSAVIATEAKYDKVPGILDADFEGLQNKYSSFLHTHGSRGSPSPWEMQFHEVLTHGGGGVGCGFCTITQRTQYTMTTGCV